MINRFSPKCYWITGLPGAGKSAFSQTLSQRLQDDYAFTPVLLDGDELRAALGKTSGHYDLESRKQLAFTYARLCQLFVCQGHTIICATVSMFEEVRNWNRNNIQGYQEVFLEVPEEILESRNQKNLYANRSKNIPGVTQQVELPVRPHYKFINDGTQSLKELVDNLFVS